jgi:hypothetical protein
MNKIPIFILSLTLLIFLCACGQNRDNSFIDDTPSTPDVLLESTVNAEYPTLNGEPFAGHFNGFTSVAEGWFVGSTGVALGMQHSYVFLTHDGGKTWAETGNVNDICPNVLTCALFVDDKTGFLCFRYTDGAGPLYRTENGGETWERCEVPAVTELLNGDGIGEVRTIRVTKENDLEMTYFASPEGDVNTGRLYTSVSTDSGKTWGILLDSLSN